MRLDQNVRPWISAVFAIFALVVMEGWRDRLSGAAAAASDTLSRVEAQRAETEGARDRILVLRDMKARDLAVFKAGMGKLTESRRGFYESGLQLQEEKRQLEKLWELLTTYLMIEQAAGRVNIMRGDQVQIGFAAGELKFLGDETRAPTALDRVTAKERFAAPARGVAQAAQGGRLEFKPPEQGGASRAAALGEHVLFTEGPLVLHGPAKDAGDHAAYPHACLSLSAWSAQRLYDRASVGTKILLRK